MDKNLSAIIIIAVICITVVRIARIVVAYITYRNIDPELRNKLMEELERRNIGNIANDNDNDGK